MKKPRNLRYGHDDSIACSHRDRSVCPECAKKYAPELVECYSKWYWIPDPKEREALLAPHPITESKENNMKKLDRGTVQGYDSNALAAGAPEPMQLQAARKDRPLVPLNLAKMGVRKGKKK